MYINFDITPEANVRALVSAANVEVRMDDLLVGEPVVLTGDPSTRNTSITLTGNGTGVYGVQTRDVKYNRRAVSDSEVTTGVLTVEVPYENYGQVEVIKALVIAQCVVAGAEDYLDVAYSEELTTVTFTPNETGALCLVGEVVVTFTISEEVAVLSDDLSVTELNGFNAPE